jgi:hypothetical protein
MRVADHYNLNQEQPALDFINVDTTNDIKAFIDPRALRLLPSDWGNACVSVIQNYFRKLLSEIKNNPDGAKKLLRVLHEPNETHLGFSRSKSQGKALGIGKADLVWEALTSSEAVASGLLEDLEDTILLIEGIGPDIVSDMTTNIIREQLIQYTQEMCNKYSIPTEEVGSGAMWNPQTQVWFSNFVKLPSISGRRLLLVPKIIIRRKMDYDEGEYYQHYILNYLQEVELSANSELVKLLKDKTRRVTKKDVKNKYGYGKGVIVNQTKLHPEILQRYRDEKTNTPRKPLTHEEISELEGISTPDWDTLIHNIETLTSGTEQSHNYEVAVEQLLTALFYPNLVHPISQNRIHRGRKRIDITYTNVLTGIGFFSWLGLHYTAPNVFIECKNYGKDVENPELDQLASRFSPSRGQFGILVCRNFENKDLFYTRCKDTVNDQRGYIIPLDDFDLKELVELRKNNNMDGMFQKMKSAFNRIIM